MHYGRLLKRLRTVGRAEAGLAAALLQLSADLGDLLKLLQCYLMAVQCSLDRLYGFMFTLRQFFQTHGVLLLLLQHLAVHLARLFCLTHHLLDDLLTLVDLAAHILIQDYFPPQIGSDVLRA